MVTTVSRPCSLHPESLSSHCFPPPLGFQARLLLLQPHFHFHCLSFSDCYGPSRHRPGQDSTRPPHSVPASSLGQCSTHSALGGCASLHCHLNKTQMPYTRVQNRTLVHSSELSCDALLFSEAPFVPQTSQFLFSESRMFFLPVLA